VLTAMLMLAIALWAEAGLALMATDQVLQCSMTTHQMQSMGEMTCCPGDEAQGPALNGERPPCCSVSNEAERPLAFVVSSERATTHLPDAVATVGSVAPQASQHYGVWRSALAPRVVKPVLELKTDLRI
jgi:Tfp pilus assembly protein PilV